MLLLLFGSGPTGVLPLSPGSASASGTLGLKPRLSLSATATCSATLTFTAPATPLINIYYGSPTSGGTDGTRANATRPIRVPPLLAGTGSDTTSQLKLAVRANSGKSRAGSFPIRLRGSSAIQWALAPDSGGSPGTYKGWGDTLYLAGSITDTNTIFWAKARCTTDETTSVTSPSTSDNLQDTSVIFRIPTDAV